MGSSARLITAMSLIALPVTSGLAASPGFAAEAVVAKGGCWAYTVTGTSSEQPGTELVEATTQAVKATGAAGITDGLLGVAGPTPIAWSPSPDGARLEFDSRGSTAKAGKRHFELTLSDGPALAADAVEGKAYAALQVSVPGEVEPRLVFAESDFRHEAGKSIDALEFTTPDGVALDAEGEYSVVLQSIYFVQPDTDATKAPQMWVCNGQEAQDATDQPVLADGVVTPGANPVTSPVALDDVAVKFAVADATTLTVSDVLGQSVNSAVRGGDEILLSAAGLDTDTSYSVGFGPDAGPFVLAGQTLTTDAEGNVTAPVTVLVPEGYAPGVGVVTLVKDGKAVGAQLRMSLLDTPSLTVAEVVSEGRLELTVLGAGFDPANEVRLRSRVGDDAGSDKVLRFKADTTGNFEATYDVKDVDADAVRALQKRVDGRVELSARHVLESAVPVVPPSKKTPTENKPGAKSPVAPSSPVVPSSPVAAAPIAPPVNIPVPAPVPVEQINAPTLPEEMPPDQLKVSKARLEGSPSAGELFGGASRREVRFEVENVGESPVSGPEVRLGVGRTTDAEATQVATTLGDLAAGARVAVDVNVSLPMGSFGTYQVVGQVGDEAATTFAIRWDTYPWGLLTVNALGVGLLAWGVTRRRRQVAPIPAGPAGEEMGASVVDLGALDKWWKEGRVVHTVPEPVEDNDSVVDLDAADRWWSRRDNKVS